MKKFNLIVLGLILLFLSACGADYQYILSTNTENQTMSLEVNIEVKHSDYKSIDGGKESLFEIINLNKPQEFSYSVKEEDSQDIYTFELNFNSYANYKEIFKKITNSESTSILKNESFNEESPFISTTNIEINDDIALFMQWLEDGISKSGKIKEEDKDKIVASSNVRYEFNEVDKYSQNIYSENEIQKIENSSIDITLRRGGLHDMTLKFSTVSEYDSFYKNLKKYINQKKGKLHLKFQKENDAYQLIVKDINLQDKGQLQALSNILGEEFITFTYSQEQSDSIFSKRINQLETATINPIKLFSEGVNEDISVKITYDGVEPPKTKINANSNINNSQMFTLNNGYTEVKIFFIILGSLVVISILLAIVLILRKIGFKRVAEHFFKLIQKGKQVIEENLQSRNIKEFIITNDIIDISTTIIPISAVDLVSIERKLESSSIMKSCGLIILVFIASASFEITILKYLSLLYALVYGAYIYFLGKTRVLKIRLKSGKYSVFNFEDELLYENYKKIIATIELFEGENNDEN